MVVEQNKWQPVLKPKLQEMIERSKIPSGAPKIQVKAFLKFQKWLTCMKWTLIDKFRSHLLKYTQDFISCQSVLFQDLFIQSQRYNDLK